MGVTGMKRLLWAGIFIFYITIFVHAQPGPGSSAPIGFFGDIELNGAPAKDGILVTAKIYNQDVESDTTKNGGYGYDLKFDVPNNDDNEGKTIRFFIQGFDTEESSIFSYESPPYQLDLDLSGDLFCGDNLCGSSESCTSCSSDCGTCPPASVPASGSTSSGGDSGGGSGGGGGGGGGGGFTYVCNQDWECTAWSSCANDLQTRQCEFVKVSQHAQTSPCATQDSPPATSQKCQIESCASDWVCSDWLPCISASQKRVCVDANRCSPETNRPEEERQCELTQSETQETSDISNAPASQGGILRSIKNFFNDITGASVADTGDNKNVIAAIVAAVVIMASGVVFIYRNKIFKKKENL